MSVIVNKWVEKERKKKGQETSPSYASSDYDIIKSTKLAVKRHTHAARGTYVRTLRGVRK